MLRDTVVYPPPHKGPSVSRQSLPVNLPARFPENQLVTSNWR